MWHTLRNRVWKCFWTNSGLRSGWNCLQTPIWGVLSQIWPNFMQIAISPMLWWHVKLIKIKKKTEIQCQRSECNFGCSCWRFWCVCSGGQDHAWDSTAAAINSKHWASKQDWKPSSPSRKVTWLLFINYSFGSLLRISSLEVKAAILWMLWINVLLTLWIEDSKLTPQQSWFTISPGLQTPQEDMIWGMVSYWLVCLSTLGILFRRKWGCRWLMK